MKINREGDTTTIESFLMASGVGMKCVIKENKNGDNAEAGFSLTIGTGGQVEQGCDLKMEGPCERMDFLPFLKQIVYEIELIEKCDA